MAVGFPLYGAGCQASGVAARMRERSSVCFPKGFIPRKGQGQKDPEYECVGAFIHGRPQGDQGEGTIFNQ